jgi:tetratricopeptide (TPR) repeat protein
MKVTAWSEKIIIPTYEVGTAEKNPIFLEKRIYQGSSGKVYPFPVVEKISDTKIDKEWTACYLENDYVKIMILPELGGRVQMAFDKVKKRHFVYYNEVIKPALVGLTGPWISGGIEFNWPQHHRPSTYSPVDFSIEEHEDGSKTVWCNEIERMSRTKGMAGFRLYPDKAYLEINAKLYNRTSQPQTFLWWANPAVAVNDDYQSVFPPDVNAVFDHGKRDVSEFPIAKGTYYKFDYSPGTDISRYKNIPVPTSYMAIKSDYNFVGGFEHDSKGGLLHVANHHISPGKKQWTWGHGDFGRAWDRNLTDKNGPYIELMCGVYTDNQPDFSWLMPYEEKAFTQYFMPYQDIGVVKNASKDAMLNLEFIDEKLSIKAYATGVFPNATIKISNKEEVVFEEQFGFKPGISYAREIHLDEKLKNSDYEVVIVSETGVKLIDWKVAEENSKEIPEAAKAAKDPKDIETNEELYLNGQHLEQYRHATYSPLPYYAEALKRDPKDIRCNNALGLLLFRNGRFEDAETYFLKAYKRQLERNPNPYDGEPLFNLGLALRYQGKMDEAYDAFYKSVWSAAFMDAGYFQVALIDAKRGNWDLAIDTVERSLIRNWHNHKARHLKVAILRKLGKQTEANGLIADSLAIDLFNYGLYFEKHLLGDAKAKDTLVTLSRGDIQNYIEVSLDYADAGLYQEAIKLIDLGINQQASVYPMAQYFKAWFLSLSGDSNAAKIVVSEAESCLSDYCFPNRLEAIPALNKAIELLPECAKAPYYLGNLFYNSKRYDDAIICWELSVSNDDTFATVYRNLALAYFNKSDNVEKATVSMETAFHLDLNDARVFMELDQLYKKLNRSIDFRLALYKENMTLVDKRDDLYIEWVYLNILSGNFHDAYTQIKERTFHPWEGGEGKVTTAYVTIFLGLSQIAFQNKNYKEAINYLEASKVFPHNLGEGKLDGAQENEIDYWQGCAYKELGDQEKARQFWVKASEGLSDPAIAWFYNDQQPDTIYYQGLALLKLGEADKANIRFDKLIDFGKSHLNDSIKVDYFAVSLPDLMIWEEDLDQKNKVHCYYMMALGYKGKNDAKAEKYFEILFNMEQHHLGVFKSWSRK